MMYLIKSLFFKMPYFIQNLVISLINTNLYRVRHSGKYQYYREYFEKTDLLNKNDLALESEKRLKIFLEYATKNSSWFQSYAEKGLSGFPILEKKDLLENLELITTISSNNEKITSKTSGTTGTALKVYYTKEDMQERFALLDHFREKYGYKLGKKTAWFSGKKVVIPSDLEKGICYRDDFINKIRFYSTFDINARNFNIYWNSLQEYKPEYIVGYPSSVYEICALAKSKGLKSLFSVKVFFPTAETVLDEHRAVIESILGCKVVDQYASSEGAPFILECPLGGMHIHPLSGIFEYKYPGTDNKEILVTSFSTRGTPLIRYSVGDSIEIENDLKCACGSNHPLVKNIEGRKQDYIYTKDMGKISLSHITLCINEVEGILLLQAVQDDLHELKISIVVDSRFNANQEKIFIMSLRRMVGQNIIITLKKVDDIPKEKSGKFRIVKNNIKSI
ncbi:phenylacetate--CoA ligase family protein [Acinetobacter radioresistens]|uniref:phenylacetate--CoA ligase family protein n=1 Tax=Acinetobacter radioresistens TaxID=40216 RepID=UPI0021CD6882|nr:phenylacetate--CoA ligase family protein [Acinetobacter radioresistens]